MHLLQPQIPQTTLQLLQGHNCRSHLSQCGYWWLTGMCHFSQQKPHWKYCGSVAETKKTPHISSKKLSIKITKKIPCVICCFTSIFQKWTLSLTRKGELSEKMTTDNDDVTLLTHLRVLQRAGLGEIYAICQIWVAKCCVCSVYQQSDILGKDAWKISLRNYRSNVKALLKNTLYFQCEYHHTRLYSVLEKRLNGNNDNQSPCWLPSFPTFDKCCSAPPPSYFSILFATLPSDWNTRGSVNNVCFPVIMSPSRIRTSCLNQNIASCLHY